MGVLVSWPPGHVFVSAIVAVVVSAASGSASAACYRPEQQLPAQAVAQFVAHPDELLSQYANGGAPLISLVRDLVASEPKALPLILDLVPRANDAQLQAFGTALGEATLACVRPDQAFANDIQQMVVAVNNETLHVAFGAVLGDQNLAAVDPAGAGGGGGPTDSTPTTGLGGFAINPPNLITSVVTVPDKFTIPTASGSSPGNTSTSSAFSGSGNTLRGLGSPPGNVSNLSVSPSTP